MIMIIMIVIIMIVSIIIIMIIMIMIMIIKSVSWQEIHLDGMHGGHQVVVPGRLTNLEKSLSIIYLFI